jgi:hypothetical protein
MLTPSAGLSWGNHAAHSPHLCRYHPFPVHSFGETGSSAFMADWSLPSRSGGSKTLLLLEPHRSWTHWYTYVIERNRHNRLECPFTPAVATEESTCNHKNAHQRSSSSHGD